MHLQRMTVLLKYLFVIRTHLWRWSPGIFDGIERNTCEMFFYASFMAARAYMFTPVCLQYISKCYEQILIKLSGIMGVTCHDRTN